MQGAQALVDLVITDVVERRPLGVESICCGLSNCGRTDCGRASSTSDHS
ncbi:hypothetical protein [Kitasatospora sp. A2-31]|nr:hypothetical protein [Kitasatospora sp. A2-31]MCG6499507.1 hypothetical protein [Kitasatospora sp. A2-31]